MDYKIIWRGNEHTNKSSRRGYYPKIIVNHITDGSAQSCDNWFRSATNDVSSAHFMITKEGVIYQYVNIEDNAWANGIKTSLIKKASAKIVHDMGVNPNWYSVSIEHEGHDGDLTDAQLSASIWLHKYISQYVKEKWGHEIPFDRNHILGHFEIDPIDRAYCPGPKFPWDKLISGLRSESVQDKYLEKLRKSGLIMEEHNPDDNMTWGEFAKFTVEIIERITNDKYY